MIVNLPPSDAMDPLPVVSLWSWRLPLPGRATMASLAAQVAREFDESVADIRGGNRTRALANARAEFSARAHEAGHSWAKIGRFLERDRTGIAHIVRGYHARNG